MSYSNVLLNEHIIRNVLFKMSYSNVLQYEHIIPKVLFKKSCSKCLIKKVLFETSYSYVENVTLETSSSEEEVKIRRSRDDQRASVLLQYLFEFNVQIIFSFQNLSNQSITQTPNRGGWGPSDKIRKTCKLVVGPHTLNL